MQAEEIFTDEISEAIPHLRMGGRVLLTGVIYTARDAAHKRLVQMLSDGTPLPFEIKGQCVYHAGPCPAKPGYPIGPCGPTTSARLNAYAPFLLDAGLKAMIGKGGMGENVKQAMIRNGAVYFAAAGGAGALIAKCVRSAKTVAFPELGAEAVTMLEVKNLPLIVAIDSKGNDLYQSGPMEYREE